MASLDDVGKLPGGDVLRTILASSFNDDGTLKAGSGGAGATPTLAQVLAVGLDATGLTIANLGNDAATRAYTDGQVDQLQAQINALQQSTGTTPPSPTLTFQSLTSWARPTTGPTGTGITRTFTDKTTLQSAIAAALPGDYLKYTGTGVLSISASAANAFQLSGLNGTAANPISIDFGYPSISSGLWGTTTGNYVEFNCTSASNLMAFFIFNCSHLRIYGGSYTASGGSGIYTLSTSGGLNDVYMWDFYCHDTHFHGLFAAPGNATQSITNCSFRGECTNWGGNVASPSWDTHSEKGTGIHACLVADVSNSGAMTGNTFAIYANGSACGNGMEIGQSGGGPITGNTFYCKAVNLTKVSTSQVGGAVYPLWGSVALGSNTIGWGEGVNIQGPVLAIDNSGLSTLVNGMVVNHGRTSNTNQNTTQYGTNAYPTGFGVTYNDCT